MALKITGLNELRERLERLRADEVMAQALARQAESMAAVVQDGLSEPAGGPGHDEPWLQTGALRDSVGAEADGLQAAVGSNDSAAVPQEMGTAQMPPRPFLAPVAAGMGEKVARGVAEAVIAALKGEPEDGAVILAGTSTSGQSHSVPYNPLGIFVPGSPENEDWTHNTIRRLHDLGHILRSEQQDGEGGDDGEGTALSDLPANPDDLLQQGWEEISRPEAVAQGHRTFRNKETGLVIRADKGEAGKPGNRARDHYHILNPDKTSNRDYYLDKNGRPVSRGSDASHISPGENR